MDNPTKDVKGMPPRVWVYFSGADHPDVWTESQVSKMANPEENRAIMTPYVPEALLAAARAEVWEEAAKLCDPGHFLVPESRIEFAQELREKAKQAREEKK